MQSTSKKETLQDKLEWFIAKQWTENVKKFKYPIIAFFLSWFAFSMYMASNIGPLTKPEEWLDPENPILLPFTVMGSVFKALDPDNPYE